MTGDRGPLPTASTPLLEVTDLVKHYPVRTGLLQRESGAVRAVDGVSFSLNEGETFGLVGESGCGKSTLVKTLLFLEPPTSGEVRFRGQPVTMLEARLLRRHMQIVFQDPYTSLPPRMTVGDVVADPLRIHKLGDRATIERRVHQLLREVGLNPARAHEYPFQFSGGQRQRIGIARALAVDPALLLLDEAVSALDVSVQAQVLNLLKDLQQRHGLTYIFISHDLGVVRFMSDRIGVMYLGKIVEQGPAEAVATHPMHPYTRALLSAVPALHRRRGERIRLTGEPPKPTNPPSGCAFHPRCPMAQPICAVEAPPLREWLPGRFTACHFALASLAETVLPTGGMPSASDESRPTSTVGTPEARSFGPRKSTVHRANPQASGQTGGNA
jgi:oligopeptide/dipeptide ABC transporter ATP-binding protein